MALVEPSGRDARDVRAHTPTHVHESLDRRFVRLTDRSRTSRDILMFVQKVLLSALAGGQGAVVCEVGPLVGLRGQSCADAMSVVLFVHQKCAFFRVAVNSAGVR
jgi:hypothetical protein